MTITINGNGTVTGISVGGLPDGIVDQDMLASGVPAITTTSGTNNFTVADGNLVIGTNGHGIDFSASEGGSHTGDSILDDYETGTWTPTITGGYTSVTYADQKGRYIKIGDLVYAQFRVGFTGTSQGGS